MIPVQTRRSVITRLRVSTVVPSVSIIFERMTPKTGVIKLNTVTFDTGLCFKRTPQSEYAIAERKAR